MSTFEKTDLLSAEEKENFEGVVRIMKRVASLNKRVLQHSDVSKAEFFTLMSIRRDCHCTSDSTSDSGTEDSAHGLNVSELANQLNISLPAVSKMIRRLEEKGYLVRIPGTTDRRVISLELTQHGQELIETAICHMSDMTMEIAEQMGKEKCHTLMLLLNQVFDIMDDVLDTRHQEESE